MLHIRYNCVTHDTRKCIAPALIAAGITAAGSLAGGFFGASAQQKAVDKQNAFNLDMWNRMNAYNTPSAQKQRLIDAGLNPNLMLNNGSAGNASSSVASDAPQVGSTIQQGFQSAAQIASDYVQQQNDIAAQADVRSSQSDAADAEADYSRSQTQSQNIRNLFLLRQLKAETKNAELRNTYQELENAILSGQKEDLIDKPRFENQLMANQTANQASLAALNDVNRQIANVNLSWLPNQLVADYTQKMAAAKAYVAQANLAPYQARMYLASASLSFAQAHGVRIDNDVREATKDLSVGLVENEYYKGYAEAEQYRRGLNLSTDSKIAAYVQSAGGVRNKQPKRKARKLRN